MALTTKSVNQHSEDRTPEVEVRFDENGKSYLYVKKDKKKKAKVEEPVKSKRGKK